MSEKNPNILNNDHFKIVAFVQYFWTSGSISEISEQLKRNRSFLVPSSLMEITDPSAFRIVITAILPSIFEPRAYYSSCIQLPADHGGSSFFPKSICRFSGTGLEPNHAVFNLFETLCAKFEFLSRRQPRDDDDIETLRWLRRTFRFYEDRGESK